MRLAYVFVRPGFVIGPAAYGGSAMVRALAALPFTLPHDESGRRFAATAVSDIGASIAHAVARWRAGERDWGATWDVMEMRPGNIGEVIEAFRHHYGGPRAVARLPGWSLDFGAKLADLAGLLGWSAPIRTTALAEVRRGVAGDPGPWMCATGLKSKSLDEALQFAPATVQERWFGRLFLLKPLAIGVLAAFWIASGGLALTLVFDQAVMALTAYGVAEGPARALVIATGLLDIAIGGGIALKRTCRLGLLAALVTSLAYLVAGTALAPDLWADPLGPLIKVLPSLVLTLVALAVLDDR